MPDAEMSPGGVRGEERLKWDMQSYSGKLAAYSDGAAAHWKVRGSIVDINYRIHRNHANSQLILPFKNPEIDS